MNSDRLVDIILPLAIADVYTYLIPEAIPYPQIGTRVLVPLGKKHIIGIVYRKHEGEIPEQIHIREITQSIDDQPIVTPKQLQLWEWLSEYYMCSMGEVLAAALPSEIIDDNYTEATTQYISLAPAYIRAEAQTNLLNSLKRAKKQQQLVADFLLLANHQYSVERRVLLEKTGISGAILRMLIDKGIFCEEAHAISRLRQYTGQQQASHQLDLQQRQAIDAIQSAWNTKNVTLLHGVTSSGKTEVYIHLIDKLLKEGKQVLYLVPEIALTTQLTERLQAVFGSQLVVYHSRFSNAERVEIYQEIRGYQAENRGKIILGARSAIFLPFKDLKLIIVDEEHEPSYKQQDPAPRYHARSAAIMMATWYGAKVLLGTATPSIESYHNALTGKYGLVEMPERFQGLQLPRITSIDLQRQYHRKEMYGHFSDPVVFRIREEIARGKQVILFQNRRGYSPYLQCPSCGEVPKCPNCDVSMTYHKGNHSLICHCCGHNTTAPRICPKCQNEYRAQGFGTERIEEEIQGLFPNARVARMDLDTTRRKNSHQHIIDQFAKHEVDILIGTQMVTKGLHFNDVSLVVVLQADSLLNQPDFRSYEHAFHMLEQVSGRAGRTGEQGEVMIQTFDPKNPLFDFLKRHDYLSLYNQQIEERLLFAFPPFYRIIQLTIKHRDSQRIGMASELLRLQLNQVFGERISGIITPTIARVQNVHMRQIRIRLEAKANLTHAKKLLLEQINYVRQHPNGKGCIIHADVDPI